MNPPLAIAAAQPPCVIGDLAVNGQTHASAITAARSRIVVFPELSLTGYDLRAPTVSLSDAALDPIVAACEASQSVAFVGAPVSDSQGRDYIATLRVSATGAEIVCRKTWLGAGESHRFSAGDGASTTQVDGWTVGLGICKDNSTAEHRAQLAELGVDVYLTGVMHRPDQLAMQDNWGTSIAHQCDTYVVFSSFAGPTGSGYDATAGCSKIWSPAGDVIAQAGPEPGDIARALLANRLRQPTLTEPPQRRAGPTAEELGR